MGTGSVKNTVKGLLSPCPFLYSHASRSYKRFKRLKRFLPQHPRSSGYANRNDRSSCVCGAPRDNIESRIFQVTNKENDLIYPKYYYRCPKCVSFSAVNIYFPKEMYDDNFQYLVIEEVKEQLASARVAWIKERAGQSAPENAVIFDLGAGEGAFCHALAETFPKSNVYAVEADDRIGEKFYGRNDRVIFVPDFIETFL